MKFSVVRQMQTFIFYSIFQLYSKKKPVYGPGLPSPLLHRMVVRGHALPDSLQRTRLVRCRCPTVGVKRGGTVHYSNFTTCDPTWRVLTINSCIPIQCCHVHHFSLVVRLHLADIDPMLSVTWCYSFGPSV